MIRVENLSFQYRGRSKYAIKNLYLQVEKGEFITITGPSGCGKSTLAFCLTGYIPHGIAGTMQGRVRVGGFDTWAHPVHVLSRTTGLVQQDPEAQLCTTRVEDEVAFGPENHCLPRSEVAARVEWALEAVGALNLRNRAIHTLSGGEKQKVAIASMLAMRPSVLVLDEPTSGLDPRATAELLEVLKKLQNDYGLTVIIIEHKLEYFLPLSSRVIHLDNGSIAYDRHPDQRPGARFDAITNNLPFDPSGRESLRVDALSLRLGENYVLKDISLSCREGEILALMGPNGAGKTSLLLCIMGLVKPTAGKIFFRGRDISRVIVSQRARMMAFVFQNPNHQIFTDQVLEEIYVTPRNLGIKSEVYRKAAGEILQLYGLQLYKNEHPLALSFGQKRRLNLASVLCHRPALLLLDEPLVGQDRLNAGQIMQSIMRFAGQGGTIIMVCHDPRVVAKYCHRLVFIENGRILVDKPVPEAFAVLRSLGKECFVPKLCG